MSNTLPSKPLNVQTQNILNKMVVVWDQPATTGGNLVPLTAFKFFFRTKDGVNFKEVSSTLCGEDKATMISTRKCSFSMDIFTADLFGLV